VGAPLPTGQASLRPAAPCRAAPLPPNCLITGVAPARDSGGITVAGNSRRAGQRSKQAERCRRGQRGAGSGRQAGRPARRSGPAGRSACQPWGISPALSAADQPRGWPAPATGHRLDHSRRLAGAPERPVLHVQDPATRSTASAPGGSRATAATSDRHAARLVFQSMSEPSADSWRLNVVTAAWASVRRSIR
jgi:hypothetical protein